MLAVLAVLAVLAASLPDMRCALTNKSKCVNIKVFPR